MEARPVDPRDVEIEVDDPAYRVVFWKPGPPAPDGGAPGMYSDSYDVTEADVEEVLAWARARCTPGQTFTLHAKAGTTAVRLFGVDPTRNDG